MQDQASQPLFSNVNESKLRNITTFSSKCVVVSTLSLNIQIVFAVITVINGICGLTGFMTLLDNYERSTGVTEQVTTEELTEMDLFLDAVLETKVMKVCGTTSSVEQKVYI